MIESLVGPHASEESQSSSVAVLTARDLQLWLGGRLILDLPSLEVRESEVLAVIGPNGSGKSSLLQVLAFLQPPTAGQVFFRGEPVDARANPLPYRRRMAMVFQEPLLLSSSVYDNVALGLRIRGWSGGVTKPQAMRWLDRLGIAHLATQSAVTLSGGEAQRASLARALALQPEVLLLDEPFSALDAPTRAALLEDMETILSEARLTAVFVTHDRGEALALGDRIAVLIDGRIQQLGTPHEVFASPVSEEVASFVGVENILPGEVIQTQDGLSVVAVRGARVEIVGEHTPGHKVLVCLRPEDITIAPTSSEARPTSARNAIVGAVSRLSPLGPLFRVVVDCGFPLVAAITRRSCLDLGLEPGTPVVASFKASAVHVIRRD